ncbi:glycosyltransferase family 4 protein [Kordiimonas pumila]|uniref:Glycosyltransferase family 4 protein n=1 Tax=Kordiimonas pumila TaxID=2161677 RepID=A0ABV7D2G9_9PROT|nr:glycosyltransferase family 4 protein [Kordiimonas pumila]
MVQSGGKCLLISTHHLPLVGGALTVYDALARYGVGRIEILTASHDYHSGEEVAGWREFDAHAGYIIHRLSALRVGKGISPRSNPLQWLKLSLTSRLVRKRVLRAVRTLLSDGGYSCLCIGDMGFLGWIANHKKILGGIRIVQYVHGEEVSQQAHSARAEKARRAILDKVDGIITVSRFTADILIEKGVAPDKILVSHNGVDLNRFTGVLPPNARSDLDLPLGPLVFSLGRLVARKGFDTLIEAWPFVLEKIPNASLIIGGIGMEEQALKGQVQALNLQRNITFLGAVSEECLARYYGAADVFALPNRTMPDGETEGFGLVFLEAAAMATPSVGGRAGGAVEAIVNGETGFLVTPTSPKEIAEAICRLLQDDGLRSQMGQAARLHAEQNGWHEKVQAFLAFTADAQALTGLKSDTLVQGDRPDLGVKSQNEKTL